MSLTDSSITDELKNLVVTIKETIEKGKRDGKLVPDQEAYLKWVIQDFSYTDSGVQHKGAHGQQFVRDDWFRTMASMHNTISDLSSYKTIENKLKSGFPDYNVGNLDHFTRHVIRTFLHEKATPLFVEEVVKQFISELKGENVLMGTEVELDGIFLQSKSIKLGEGYILRQTQVSDLEIEYAHHSFESRHIFPPPSAVLRIEMLGKNPYDVQRKEARAIALFRLFKVGSIIYYKSRMFSHSITYLGGGTGYSGGRASSLNKYLIKEDEVGRLQNFWTVLYEKIPDTFTGFNNSDFSFRDIAYKRYEDALLYNGTIERRIANAIMGIEAIFLRSTEQDELSYRLRLRVAKIMGLFNEDPFIVKNKIRDAYAIRSNFVHGGLLSYDKKDEFAEKYESMNNLLQDILNYLRISIITILLMPIGKDEFLATIDKSFLKKDFDNMLNNYVRLTKQITLTK